MNFSKNNRYQEKKLVDLDETSWLLLDTKLTRVVSDHGGGVVCSCFSYLSDPNCRPYRYMIAILLSYILGVLSFCVDIPGGIQSTMIRVMRIDNTHYSIIFSSYSWPDAIMSLAGIVIVNQYTGIHYGFIFFGLVVLIGQIVISVGAYVNSFSIMLMGRMIYGSGFGTTGSLIMSYQVLWFEGKEVTFVSSLARCMCRLMASVALFTPQLIYDALSDFLQSPTDRHGTTQMVGTLFCLLAVGSIVTVVFLDMRGTRIIGRRHCIKKRINVRDVMDFPFSYWVLTVTIAVFYSIAFSFTSNAPLFIANKYGFGKVTANLANSLSYLSVAILGPVVAVIIDLYGYNIVWGLAGIVLVMLSQLINAGALESDVYVPYLAAVLTSVAYTFVGTALYVTPALLVANHHLTTAFGILSSLFSIMFSVIGVTAGIIIDHLGYLFLLLFYLLLLFVIGLLNIVLLIMESFSAGSKLLGNKKNQRS